MYNGVGRRRLPVTNRKKRLRSSVKKKKNKKNAKTEPAFSIEIFQMGQFLSNFRFKAFQSLPGENAILFFRYKEIILFHEYITPRVGNAITSFYHLRSGPNFIEPLLKQN